MTEAVTEEDYALACVRAVMADPDSWSEFSIQVDKIIDAPAMMTPRRAMRDRIIRYIEGQCPTWYVDALDENPMIAMSEEARKPKTGMEWSWVHVVKNMPATG